ncbi:MAG: hypothetical protein K8F53_14130 [Rhodocyclaceae bacterium]|jgi:hypothetical protein|nr:hypothetical protein [Rhodocyclaceae bacterium]
MLLLINVPARDALVLPQILALVARQHAIRFVLAFLGADCLLLAAQIPRFLPSQAAITHAIAYAVSLIVLARIHTRIAHGAILPAPALLSIVFLIVYVAARPVLVATQVGTLRMGQVSVRTIAALFLADVTLLALQAVRLGPVQFARAHTLADTLLLVVLAGIDAPLIGARLCGRGQPKGGHAGKKHADKQGSHFTLLYDSGSFDPQHLLDQALEAS